jgi:FtsZ-interacting cell division protein ZipA
MGSTAIVMGAVAVAIALICLLLGYRWGRSKLRSQIEEAIKKERISLDAREFTLREQLDDQMAELVALRAHAEEFASLQGSHEKLNREQIRQSESIAESSQDLPAQMPNPTPPFESADAAVQKLLKSIEDNLRQPVVEPPKPGVDEPRPNISENPMPALVNIPESPKPESQKPEPIAKPASKKPEPQEGPKTEPTNRPESKKPDPIKPADLPPSPIVEDEWQEFASSLAALTRRKN